MGGPPQPEDETACEACQGAGVITDTSDDTDIAPVVECPDCYGSGTK
jgi:DnaJ-class molecular chaperone